MSCLDHLYHNKYLCVCGIEGTRSSKQPRPEAEQMYCNNMGPIKVMKSTLKYSKSFIKNVKNVIQNAHIDSTHYTITV